MLEKMYYEWDSIGYSSADTWGGVDWVFTGCADTKCEKIWSYILMWLKNSHSTVQKNTWYL